MNTQSLRSTSSLVLGDLMTKDVIKISALDILMGKHKISKAKPKEEFHIKKRHYLFTKETTPEEIRSIDHAIKLLPSQMNRIRQFKVVRWLHGMETEANFLADLRSVLWIESTPRKPINLDPRKVQHDKMVRAIAQSIKDFRSSRKRAT